MSIPRLAIHRPVTMFMLSGVIVLLGAIALLRLPVDLMPELQGRFPIRVELSDLTKDDFVRILKEPKNALTRQYEALLETEGVKIEFTDDAIESLAEYAFQVNQTSQNIGARRLYTIMERMLEDLSFEAPDKSGSRVSIPFAEDRRQVNRQRAHQQPWRRLVAATHQHHTVDRV